MNWSARTNVYILYRVYVLFAILKPNEVSFGDYEYIIKLHFSKYQQEKNVSENEK